MPTSTPKRSSSPRSPASATTSRPASRKAGASSPARSGRPRRRRTGPLTWCEDDFLWFFALLTNPDGQPAAIEPFLRLIIREVFVTGRVELLCLLPKGNGKTFLFAALAVFHLLTVANANCYIGAADKIQADEMYRFACHFVESEPELEALLLVRKSTREIRSRRDNGFIRVLASDDSKLGGKKQGFNPTLALIDELHAHDNSNLYTDMRSGLFKRKGLIVTITTAGSDEESVLGVLRRGFLDFEARGGTVQRDLVVTKTGAVRVNREKGRLTICRAKTGRTVMLEWACRLTDDLDDMAVVKLASPSTRVTIDSLIDAAEAPGITPADFARWRANVWAQAADAVIAEGAWDSHYDPERAVIPDHAAVWVIVDYARKSDSTACTELYTRPEDGLVVPKAHVWALKVKQQGRVQPPAHTVIEGERTIRQSLVRDHIRGLRDAGKTILGVIFDPHLFDPEELGDEGFEMIEFPQKPERTVPASKQLFEAINEGRVIHDGDPVLRSHVIHAGSRTVGEGWRFSKAASKKHIDALITLMMGIGKALERPGGFGMEWH